MTIDDAILSAVRTLPPELQQEVLHFAENLKQRTPAKQPLRSVLGLWAAAGGNGITEDDIAGIRREMGERFPHEDVA